MKMETPNYPKYIKAEKMKKEFNLNEKIKQVDIDLSELNWVYPKEDVKEFIKLLKVKITKKFDKFTDGWYKTDNPEIAQLRLQISALIFGNDGYLEDIDKLVGKSLI